MTRVCDKKQRRQQTRILSCDNSLLTIILDPTVSSVRTPHPRSTLMPDMALVAPPTSVWRDPSLLASAPSITSMSMSSLPLHHALNGGLSPSDAGAVSPGLGSSVTPIPPSDVSQQSSDNESGGTKDENGQEISCVVCNDKSSGKHYGQFTCEGETE